MLKQNLPNLLKQANRISELFGSQITLQPGLDEDSRLNELVLSIDLRLIKLESYISKLIKEGMIEIETEEQYTAAKAEIKRITETDAVSLDLPGDIIKLHQLDQACRSWQKSLKHIPQNTCQQ